MRQSPLLGKLGLGADQTPPYTSGNTIPAHAGSIGRRSSAPEGNLQDFTLAATNHAATRQDGLRVQSAPASDQGGIRCHVPPQRGGDVIRFGVEQVFIPRLSSTSTPGPTPWPSTSAIQLSSGEGSPRLRQQQASQPSTISAPSRRESGSGSRSALAALRAEREAVEAEARQAMARAAPNLFPEILVAPPTAGEAGGSGDGIRGRKGWVAGA